MEQRRTPGTTEHQRRAGVGDWMRLRRWPCCSMRAHRVRRLAPHRPRRPRLQRRCKSQPRCKAWRSSLSLGAMERARWKSHSVEK